MAIARALIAGSMRSANWTIRAASDTGAGGGLKSPEQFAVDATKTAVRHDDHEITGPVLADDRVDDLVDRAGFARGLALAAQILNEAGHGEPLVLRERRAKHWSQKNFVGDAKCLGKVVLELAQMRAEGFDARRPASVSATAVG